MDVARHTRLIEKRVFAAASSTTPDHASRWRFSFSGKVAFSSLTFWSKVVLPKALSSTHTRPVKLKRF